MKHSRPGDCLAALRDGVLELGLSLPESALRQSCAYLGEVLALNERLNLTRIHESRSAVRLHLLDSLTALPEVASGRPGRLLDLGTGGGFPGVPLALASQRDAVVLDSSSKKIRAVGLALEAAGITGVEPVASRAEEYASAHASEFGVVVARAVAPLASLAELAAPLLAMGGIAVFLKGQPQDAELAAGEVAAGKLGLTQRGARQLLLPGVLEGRVIITYEKTGEPMVMLPRRTGLAQKRPLA